MNDPVIYLFICVHLYSCVFCNGHSVAMQFRAPCGIVFVVEIVFSIELAKTFRKLLAMHFQISFLSKMNVVARIR